MSDRTAPSEPPTDPAPPSGLDALLAQHRFPRGAPVAPPPGPAPGAPRPRASAGVFSRVILPTALFLLAVGVIAFVTQNLPSWRNPQKAPRSAAAGPPKATIRFPEPRALWDPRDEDYALEIEPHEAGHYDYLFVNDSDAEATLGLQGTSCDCSEITACVLTPAEAQAHKDRQDGLGWEAPRSRVGASYDWVPLVKDEANGLGVPAGKAGLLRLSWKNRKHPGERLRLTTTVWFQPKGVVKDRLYQALDALVVVTHPVSFSSDKIDLGTLVPRSVTRRDFWCWTSTRNNLEVEAGEGKLSPCYSYEIRPVPEGELAALQDKLRGEGINTRVRAAARVTVEVAEERGGDQLDMGPVSHQVVLALEAGGEPVSVTTPVVTGWVRGDIRVGGSRDRDVISLGSYRRDNGTRAEAVLFTDRGTQVKYLEHQPPFLKLDLAHKERAGDEEVWRLEVTVPPDAQEGPLPEGSHVLLQSTRPNGESRRVRVPVTGTAISN